MRARARTALIAVLAACAIGGIAAGGAEGFVSYYDCYMKPSGQWCDGRANGSYDGQRSWDYNEAWYPGPWNGTVLACQRVYKPSSGQSLVGASCALNRVAIYYGNVLCVCYEAHARQISGGPHSIAGIADDNF